MGEKERVIMSATPPASAGAQTTTRSMTRGNIFFGSFLTILLFNLAITVMVFSVGISTGVEGKGKLRLNWEQVGNTIEFLFGGLESLFALIGGVVITVLALRLVLWLSVNKRHNAVIIVSLIGMVIGGFILWKLVNWNDFGRLPLPLFLVFTALEALVAVFVIAGLSTIKSRIRGTTH